MAIIGTRHLADNPQLYEPGRTNNFEFIVTGLENLLFPGVSEELANSESYIKNPQETLRVSVDSSSVPHFNMSVIDVKRGNNTMHFAGTPEFQNVELVLTDFMGARTKDAILAWQALAYNVRTEKVSPATRYKKDCTLIEYSPDYERIIRYWELKGCWISEVSEDNFDNNNNDKKTITATVVYDRAIPHLPDVD